MRSVKILGAAGVLMATALVGGTLIGGVLAAPSGTSPSETDADTVPALGDGEYCHVFISTFAGQLGSDEAALEDAWRTATEAAIDAVVEAGDLDADRATAIKDNIDEANLEMCRILAGHPRLVWKEIGHRARTFFLHDLLGSAAETLNMEPADLLAELRDDATLEELAEQQGVSYDTVRQQILAEAQANLDTAVAEGLISQERADGAYQRLEAWLDEGGDPPFGPAGRGGFGPRGHWRGGAGFGWPALDGDAADEPSS